MIKISNWAIFAMLVGIGLLIFALIKGCQQVKNNNNAHASLVNQVDSLTALNKQTEVKWALSDSAYRDTLQFERGQKALIEAQKERIENELTIVNLENVKLINKYKEAQYTDTTTTIAPKEFIDDCKDCFSRLEITNNLTLKYKKEINEWGLRFKRETEILENRIAGITKERNDYHSKVDSITVAQAKTVSKIQSHGRLYLSWGVLLGPFPKYAGAGLMYQTKRNMIFGGTCYYGDKGYLIQANMHFPLSLKIK